jgi:hypothetical protein
MKRAAEKEIAEHVIRPVKVIPTNCVQAGCGQLLITALGLWKVLKMVDDSWERRMVGKSLIVSLK